MPNIKSDLEKLPLRAIVAFAARCARRVSPLYVIPSDSEGLEEHQEALSNAIRIAAAFSSTSVDFDETSHRAASAAATAAEAANSYVSVAAARAAAHAADAAAAAEDSVIFAARVCAEASAEAAEAAATKALAAVKGADYDLLGAAMLSDLRQLFSLQLGPPLQLGSVLDPGEYGPLGPLWPDRTPEWYPIRREIADPPPAGESPSSGEAGMRLILEASVDRGADIGKIAEALARLVFAMNAYHIACGGNGLVIEDWGILVPAPDVEVVK